LIDPATLDRVADRLAGADRITVLTGAGVSAASGVPTFRGTTGLWKRFRPEDLATPEAFASDPPLVWEWYDWRRQLLAACAPNATHHVLAAWARRWPALTVVTQNVDGLHERAGLDAVVRLHGSIWEVQCWARCASSPPRWRDETVPFPTLPPRCPWCGDIVRPGVVWFGEALPVEPWDRASQATACDVFIAAGTSAIVYPAAGLIEHARSRGAFVVEINPDLTPATGAVDAVLRDAAEMVFPALDRRLQGTSTAAP
jgi:NAD-dependent deacetylase